MVPLTVRVFKIQQYTKIDIPNSIKVALGIGHFALGGYYLAVTQAKHCIVFRMPKCPQIAKATFIELGIYKAHD